MLKYIKQYADSIEGINIYPIISLLMFVVFFIAVICYVKKMDKQQVQDMRNMPLEQADEQDIHQQLKNA